jgi:hypothetical protein
VSVGNARRFVEEGGQASMGGGSFDVIVVERIPVGDFLAKGVAY